jgi:hypothetical protein
MASERTLGMGIGRIQTIRGIQAINKTQGWPADRGGLGLDGWGSGSGQVEDRTGSDNGEGSGMGAWAKTGLSGVIADRRATVLSIPKRDDNGSLFRSSRWTELCLVPTAAGLQPNTHIL